MGDYEDRYPEAYGRGEDPQRPAVEELKEAQSPRQTRDKVSANLRRLGLGTPAQRAMEQEPSPTADWRHDPAHNPAIASAPSPAQIIEPTATPIGSARATSGFRGVGPRGYLRSPARIHEDICDRLTENEFVDASDIEVSVTGAEVFLRGTVDSSIALRQAEEIAQETAGVAQVRSELIVRGGTASSPSTGAAVNRAMGSAHR